VHKKSLQKRVCLSLTYVRESENLRKDLTPHIPFEITSGSRGRVSYVLTECSLVDCLHSRRVQRYHSGHSRWAMRRNRKHPRKLVDTRNPYEKMSFAQALNSPEWKQYLEDARPFAIFARTWVEFRNGSELNSQQSHFALEAEVDEEAIMLRFHDYLVRQGDDPNSFSVPIPAVVLREFLNSLGAVDMPIWNSQPVDTLIRAVQGDLPISGKLSARISDAFGTRTTFWFEMQQEYDDWCKHPTRS
jgi:hypothetical protein